MRLLALGEIETLNLLFSILLPIIVLLRVLGALGDIMIGDRGLRMSERGDCDRKVGLLISEGVKPPEVRGERKGLSLGRAMILDS